MSGPGRCARIATPALILAALCVTPPLRATCASANRGVQGSAQFVVLNPVGFTGPAAPSDVFTGGTMWNGGCNTTGIPEFDQSPPGGGAGYAQLNVMWNSGLSPTQGVCGDFSGNTVNIYQYTISRLTGQTVFCGSYGFAQVVAHEMGHFLGLADTLDDANCGTDIMAQVNGLSHSVSGDDCTMADSLNVTPADRNSGCTSLEDCRQSPILINLDDGPYSLTGVADGVSFDIDGSGLLERVAWTTAGTEQAFLWLDNDGNGIVDSGWELFGDLRAANGFEALKAFDLPSNGGNGDGILDERDAVWPRLRLWIDYNHNGISEPNEIFTLRDKGIRAIGLDYQPSGRKDSNGNLFRYWSWVATEHHGRISTRKFYDVYLVMNR